MRRRHRRVHCAIWSVLLILVPAILIAALAIRRDGPLEAPAIQLAQPR